MNLDALFTIITKRFEDRPRGSYVSGPFNGPLDRIIQKVGEESTEVVIAAKNSSKKRQVAEISDLFFHMLVLMAKLDISLDDIYKELDKRRKKEA